MTHWSAPYVGMPFADRGRTPYGCDCWGLVCLVYQRELRIELPRYDTIGPAEQAEIAAAIGRDGVPPTWTKVDRRRAFDLVLFRLGRHDSHVGIALDGARMLHADREAGAVIAERVDRVRWSQRYTGAFRHELMRAPA